MRCWIPVVLLGVAACSAPESPPAAPNAYLVVWNGTSQPLVPVVDGQGTAATSIVIPAGNASPAIPVAAGSRTLRISGTTTSQTATISYTASPGLATVRVVRSGTGAAFDVGALSDTGAVPAPGTSKLRMVHLSLADSSVDLWRIQPDYPQPVRFMFPFAYGATSSYIQSQPGTWTVIATPKIETWAAGSSQDARSHALATLEVSTLAGESKTVAFVDDGNGAVKFVVVDR